MTRWYDEPCYDRPTVEVTPLESYRRWSWRWFWQRRQREQEDPPFGFARALHEGEP